MSTIGRTEPRPLGTRSAVIALAAFQSLVLLGPATGFERATQADYDQLGYCYGRQVGAANGLADDHEHWQRAYPQPDAGQAAEIGMVQAHAVEISTLADSTATLFEDLDHPGYGMDTLAANDSYARGYAFWDTYIAMPFNTRIAVELTEALVGMSPECWQVIFKLEAMNAANAAAGELVWEE